MTCAAEGSPLYPSSKRAGLPGKPPFRVISGPLSEAEDPGVD
jgi:hypothetical protein